MQFKAQNFISSDQRYFTVNNPVVHALAVKSVNLLYTILSHCDTLIPSSANYNDWCRGFFFLFFFRIGMVLMCI